MILFYQLAEFSNGYNVYDKNCNTVNHQQTNSEQNSKRSIKIEYKHERMFPTIAYILIYFGNYWLLGFVL